MCCNILGLSLRSALHYNTVYFPEPEPPYQNMDILAQRNNLVNLRFKEAILIGMQG